jgi:hypothetical protein
MSSVAIMHNEANSSLSSIRTLGFDAALRVHYARAMSGRQLLDEARRCNKLSRSFLGDARSYAHSPVLFERFLMLSRFYRILAHMIYQTHCTQSEVRDTTFLQVV